MSAAICHLDAPAREEFTQSYQALMRHYRMAPTWNNAGIAHENGDVEQSHRRFKQAVDQALQVRGSRDFVTRAAYERFLEDLVRQRTHTRQVRFSQERPALRPLPTVPLVPCHELRLSVSRFSTITVLGNCYWVPSRLIGTTLLVRVHAETLEGYVGSQLTFTLPRLHGRGQHTIQYQHLIWSLARKAGAFAHYRYREAFYPALAFRRAYDQLCHHQPARADQEYRRMLYLAATTSETGVETALEVVLDSR